MPYRNNKDNTYEAQFIPGYKGLISLARRSGEVTSIETHIVYSNDKFDLRLGLDTHLEHIPNLEGERGQPRLVYGVAKFRDGGHHFEWMSIGDVNKIRQRSKSRDNGPWVTDYEQMVRKTLIRRMSNYLPMSIELQQAIQISDAADEGKRATIDAGFVVVQDDDDQQENAASAQNDAVNDQPRQIEHQEQTRVPPVQVSQQETQHANGEWQPTQEEMAEIEARERAEAGADAQPQQATSSRRGRGNLDIG